MKSTNWEEYTKFIRYNSVYLWFIKHAWGGYNKLIGQVEAHEIESVFEFGGGSGHLTHRLARHFNVKYLGVIDHTKKHLDISKDNLKGLPCEKRYHLDDFFNLSDRETYDLVHSQGVLEHFSPAQKLVLYGKHREIVSNKGYIIIFVPTPTLSYRIFRRIFELTGFWIFYDEVPMTLDELKGIVCHYGDEILMETTFWRLFLSEVGVLIKTS